MLCLAAAHFFKISCGPRKILEPNGELMSLSKLFLFRSQFVYFILRLSLGQTLLNLVKLGLLFFACCLFLSLKIVRRGCICKGCVGHGPFTFGKSIAYLLLVLGSLDSAGSSSLKSDMRLFLFELSKGIDSEAPNWGGGSSFDDTWIHGLDVLGVGDTLAGSNIVPKLEFVACE